MVKAVLLHVKMDLRSLTLGLLRGLEESPVDAPLTERDLTDRTRVRKILSRVLLVYSTCTFGVQRLEHNTTYVLFYFLFTKMCNLYLWLCAAVSKALRVGVGDPCSVTLRTSRLFLSGRQRPWRVSIGESTRFRGGSAEEHYRKVITGALQCIFTQGL